jgi:hypothetical protein
MKDAMALLNSKLNNTNDDGNKRLKVKEFLQSKDQNET